MRTEAVNDDVRRLLRTINGALERTNEKKLAAATLNGLFDDNWPKLEERIEQARSLVAPTPVERADREILEEILQVVRAYARLPVTVDRAVRRALEETERRRRIFGIGG